MCLFSHGEAASQVGSRIHAEILEQFYYATIHGHRYAITINQYIAIDFLC